MSSTNKTTNLKLNDWVGTDVPQREDFNADNQRIDKAIGDHTGNTTVHITQAERDLWGLPFYYYNYFGNGKATRKVEVPSPFRPRFAIVFADGMAPSVCKFSSSANYHYVAFASQTRGTIGMTRTENGYAPRAGYFRAALDAIPDLRAPEMPEWEFYELSPLLDSSNMTVREWNCIAELIAQKYDDYDGFVVLHGTDTMAYTASALSFMLDGLDKPVVLTGSQIPLCEIRSDGRDNLITALLIAGEGIVREVCLYFGGKLLRGNRATKYSADGLIAFVSPNYPSLAEAGISIKYNEAALLPRQEGGLKLQTLDNIPIGVIKVFPGIQFSLFEAIMTEKLRGIVIETFGAGNIPATGTRCCPSSARRFRTARCSRSARSVRRARCRSVPTKRPARSKKRARSADST